ncbi:neutral/alkaline non-lysosomal ceramidase N-terminal domain-containing protein [Adhaeribacter swui]|uniref:Neutral ceramidase n=1 Tax=Adhaeribacter swui TaxID=2086471 RepID=A0A7G7G2X2_9BACT|nr:neutral/alkaline non-lysosomal ceramidase N-terminal domain-containing protein [Adhaeribacter swui]QNF31506.1 neutral/alkaline non-lysosomal ceramidase N-terminal domain-containing protein [Adhaeribacter swui]
MRYLTFILVGLWLGCPACITQKIDTTPYQQTAYYQKSKEQITAFQPTALTGSDTVRVGWAKVNITPAKPVPMAGYGKRRGKKFEQVHDSVWVRAFVFKTGTQKVAWVTADLLIMPMRVTARVQELLGSKGYFLKNLFFTATHTHYSIGGWGKKPAGRIMAGKYSNQIVDNLAQSIARAILKAEQTAVPAAMAYQQMAAPEYVNNRLIGEKGGVDSLIRVLYFRKRTGEKALLCTYAAHPTSVASNDLRLSAEYPGALVKLLEQRLQLNMAAFGAGAVGSHGPQAAGAEYEKVNNLATGLATKIENRLNQTTLSYAFNLQSAFFPISLSKPQWRYKDDRRFRPWLFYTVFGKYPAGLSMLQVGPVQFIGTPCDFSGELLPAITAAHADKKIIVTSFNGSYIGYVTPQKYYKLKKYETRDMNFFGPYTGTFLTEMINLIIQKFN